MGFIDKVPIWGRYFRERYFPKLILHLQLNTENLAYILTP